MANLSPSKSGKLPKPGKGGIRLQAVKRVSLSETVKEKILDLVKSGVVKVGERLPSEYELMHQLNVGRSSVREAVRGLVLMGVLEARPRLGTTVKSLLPEPFDRDFLGLVDTVALSDFFEVRLLLEQHAAARAAELAARNDIIRIEKAARAVEKKVAQNKSYFRENADFHVAIAEASHNPVLIYCIKSIVGKLRDVREQIVRISHDMSHRDVSEHAAIVAAIKARDPRRARQAVQRHLKIYINSSTAEALS